MCRERKLFVSRPAWGAWIEISIVIQQHRFLPVAPRMGRVD